jgi:SAM-dependent methyltransferase
MQSEQRLEAVQGHLGGYIVGGDPLSWCEPVWDWLVREYSPKTLLDVGCGEGHSTKYFHDRGLKVLGLDGMPEAVRDARVPGKVLLHDFCSGGYVTSERFDLLWSCEFLEHIEERYLPGVLATFQLARTLAVTHALPGQPGYHHVNCQTNAYWIEMLEGIGFRCDVHATIRARVHMLRRPECGYFFGRSGMIFHQVTHPPQPLSAAAFTALAARARQPGWKARFKRFLIRAGIRWHLQFGRPSA